MVQFSDEALPSVLKGVQLFAKAVAVTLGPKGGNVVIRQPDGRPLSTREGLTVAREIHLKDKFENMGVQLVMEAASKCRGFVGAGTTTAVVLAHALFTEGVKSVASGSDPLAVKRGIDRAATALSNALQELARSISTHDEIVQVATISANSDGQLGLIIAKAIDRVGRDGIITTAEGKGVETILSIVEGMQFDGGYLSPYFVTNPENMSVQLEDCSLLLVDKTISTAREIVPALERIVGDGSRPLLIVAKGVEGEALDTLVINKLKGGHSICAVKGPGFAPGCRTALEDLATVTGATVVADEAGLTLEEIGPEVLGLAKWVRITRDRTTVVDGKGDRTAIKGRESEVRTALEQATSKQEEMLLEGRLTRLAGGIGVIEVGAATDVELKEKRGRVDDALNATRAALAKGIVAGGGVALLRAAKMLQQEPSSESDDGREIVHRACLAPLTAIANNCGREGSMVAAEVFEQDGAYGYNALTDEYCDMIGSGIVDPCLVVTSALLHAASVAGFMLTTAAMITDRIQAKKPPTSPM